MTEPETALEAAWQAWLAETLRGAELGVDRRVYDRVPPAEKLALPYIRIGEDQVVGDDVHCGQLSELFARIHIWSRGDGRMEAKRLGGAIRDTLRAATVALPGFTFGEITFEQVRYLDDPDGKTTHGVIDISALVTHG